MAVQGPFKASFGELFPHGAFAIAVDALNDFEKVQAGVEDPQQRDKDSGERIWAVRAIDNDPEARSNELKVKVVAPVMPSLPEPVPGTNLRPVEFEGLTVTPWVEETKTGRTRVAYSLKATGVREPASRGSSSQSSASRSADAGSSKSSSRAA
jgi:hypothetical protein